MNDSDQHEGPGPRSRHGVAKSLHRLGFLVERRDDAGGQLWHGETGAIGDPAERANQRASPAMNAAATGTSVAGGSQCNTSRRFLKNLETAANAIETTVKKRAGA